MLALRALQGTAPRPPETHPSSAPTPIRIKLQRPHTAFQTFPQGRAPPDSGAETQGSGGSVWIPKVRLSWVGPVHRPPYTYRLEPQCWLRNSEVTLGLRVSR